MAMKWIAFTASLLLAAGAAMADIVPNEPEPNASPDGASAHTVRGRLVQLGVAAPEVDRIVASLRPEELDFFGSNPKANAVVGQDEIVVMFWYEWVFGLAYAYLAWQYWDNWGCEAFFPNAN
jgi:hypothetical protein